MVHVLRPSALPGGPRTSTLRRLDNARRPRRHDARRPTGRRDVVAEPAHRQPRYCPLCDGTTYDRVCPVDGVQTISTSILERTDEPLAPGTIISGAYRIEAQIGEGAMGRVYRATQLSVNRSVAIKFLSGNKPRNKDELRRFFREALIASKLDHPNIVQVIEFGVDDDALAPFIVMKLVPGENLHELLKREGPLSVDRAVKLLTQVARALAAAHGIGLIHRDLKPANLMVSRYGAEEHVTVIDFGVAKSISPQDLALSQSGLVVGTPMYMSPEQAVGGHVDSRTDLYALGCLLHEMLTGAAPPLRLGSNAPPPRISQAGLSSLSDEARCGLVALHQALLAQVSSDRPDNALTVALAFEAVTLAGTDRPQGQCGRIEDDSSAVNGRGPCQEPMTESYALKATIRRRRPRAS